MTLKKFIWVFLLIITTSLLSLLISKFSYDSMEKRTQARLTIEENKYVVNFGNASSSNFSFDQTVNTTIQYLKSIESYEECPISYKPFFGVNSNIPKTISSRYKGGIGIYEIEIIDSNVENIEKCYSSFLNLVKIKFHDHIKRVLANMKNDQLIRSSVLRDLELENQYIKQLEIRYFKQEEEKLKKMMNKREDLKKLKDQTKLINFSDFIKLIDRNEINEIGITDDYIIGSKTNKEKFYTVSKYLSRNDVVMNKLIEKNITFNLIEGYNDQSYNNLYGTSNRRDRQLEYNIKTTKLISLLSETPFKLIEKSRVDYKVSFGYYFMTIFLLINLVAFFILIKLNKEIRGPFLIFLRKLY